MQMPHIYIPFVFPIKGEHLVSEYSYVIAFQCHFKELGFL